MIVAQTIDEVRKQIKEWRRADETVGFVPTMGALHAGHISLVEAARANRERVVVSIFVNPTQFAPNEDFNAYPRPLDKDLKLLAKAGVSLVFTPDETMVYPGNRRLAVEIKEIGKILEGVTRPHFFEGVALVVLKLLNIVQPDALYLGQKDFQQTVVLRTLIEEALLPVETVVCPILREIDGLAMSSRNVYLSPDERKAAVGLFQALNAAKEAAWEQPETAVARQAALNVLTNFPDFRLDYFEIRDLDTLQPLETLTHGQAAVALVAAFLGKTRLIDNMIIRYE